MALPSSATEPRRDDTSRMLLYKITRALIEASEVAEDSAGNDAPRVTDPENHLLFKATRGLRQYLVHLENLLDSSPIPREVVGKYRFKLDGTLQLWNPTQLGYQTISINGAAGLEYINVGDVEA